VALSNFGVQPAVVGLTCDEVRRGLDRPRERWRACRVDLPDDPPVETFVFCPSCASAEFDSRWNDPDRVSRSAGGTVTATEPGIETARGVRLAARPIEETLRAGCHYLCDNKGALGSPSDSR
jgi:hypothetical protein